MSSVADPKEQVLDSDFPTNPVCRCGRPAYIDDVRLMGDGQWLMPVFACHDSNCDNRLYVQMEAETSEVVDYERASLDETQKTPSRRPSPPTHIMQVIGGRRPPNFALNFLIKNRDISDVERMCDYCEDPEPKPRMELVKLPNGLFICAGEHPGGTERDKLGHI